MLPCRCCTSPHHIEINVALMSGVTDREVSRRYGIPCASVQRHRVRHIVKAVQARAAREEKANEAVRQRQEIAATAASAALSIEQQLQAVFGHDVVIDDYNEARGRLKRMGARAEEIGSLNGTAAIVAQQRALMEFGARYVGHPNFRPPSALPQASDKATVSIEILFTNAGKREEIALAGRPIIDGEKTDPAATNGMDLPQPHPNRRIKPDERPASAYWNFDQLPQGEADDDIED
jgi:hypothetical protein